jgi:hypothetical protein
MNLGARSWWVVRFILVPLRLQGNTHQDTLHGLGGLKSRLDGIVDRNVRCPQGNRSQTPQISCLWPINYTFWVILAPVMVTAKVQVILQPTVSQSASLSWCRIHDQIFITVGHFWSSCWGTPSLTRGRVCNLLIQFAVTLWSKSRRTHDHILLSHLRPYVTLSYEAPLTWRARSPYLYPPGTGWSSYTPRHWVPFLSPLTTRRATVEVF